MIHHRGTEGESMVCSPQEEGTMIVGAPLKTPRNEHRVPVFPTLSEKFRISSRSWKQARLRPISLGRQGMNEHGWVASSIMFTTGTAVASASERVIGRVMEGTLGHCARAFGYRRVHPPATSSSSFYFPPLTAK